MNCSKCINQENQLRPCNFDRVCITTGVHAVERARGCCRTGIQLVRDHNRSCLNIIQIFKIRTVMANKGIQQISSEVRGTYLDRAPTDRYGIPGSICDYIGWRDDVLGKYHQDLIIDNRQFADIQICVQQRAGYPAAGIFPDRLHPNPTPILVTTL